MSSSEEHLLGLFPLGIVLVPGEVVPLHVFEEPYRLFVDECAAGAEFAVVFAEDDGLRECGCSARIVEVVERIGDGSMNILVEGLRRCRLVELREPADPERECLSGLVEYYEDTEPDAPEPLCAAVVEVFRKMLALMGAESPREDAIRGNGKGY